MTDPLPNLVGVIDLMGGVVVRGVGGRRDEYRPVQSRLCNSAEPLVVANAFREQYGIEDLYVADLDAILGRGSHRQAIAGLVAAGFRVAVDCGIKNAIDATPLRDLGVAGLIAGLETLAGPEALTRLVECFGRERIVFSLDLAGGIPLARPADWNEPRWEPDSPLRLVQQTAALGVERFIVLELRAIGEQQGPVTADLCREIRKSLPEAAIWTGGGVRRVADLAALASAGVDGVLVATALHDRAL